MILISVNECQIKSRSNCGAALVASQAALHAWLKLSSTELPYSHNATQCSLEEQTRTRALLGDSSISKSQVMASSAQFSKESRGTVARLAGYAVALNDYNIQYVANKTQDFRLSALQTLTDINNLRLKTINASFDGLFEGFEGLVACVAPVKKNDSDRCTLLAHSASQMLKDMVNDYQSLFQEAAQGFKAYKDNWYDVAARSEAAFTAFLKFYNDVRDGIRSIGLSTSDFGNIFDVNFDIMMVDPGQFLDGIGILSDIPALPTLEEISSALQQAWDGYIKNLTGASIETSLRAAQWATALEASFESWDVTPDDYSPPSYTSANGSVVSIGAVAGTYDSLADAFVARTATSLETFDSYNNYIESLTGNDSFSSNDVTSSMDNLPRFDFSFILKYESFVEPDFDWDYFLQLVNSIPELAMVTDMIYRVYSSIRIILRFKSQSTGIKLPTLDVSQISMLTRGASACGNASQSLHPRKLLAWVLASPHLPRILLYAFLFPVVISASALYAVAYRNYQRGCVYRSQSGTSVSPSPTGQHPSFATQTLYSLAFNAAAYQGNQVMYDGLKDYNQRRAGYCADLGKAAQKSQLNIARYISALHSAHSETQEKVRLVASCLNVSALDLSFEKGCCTVYGNGTLAAPFDSSSESFGYPECENDVGFNASPTSCPLNTNFAPPLPFPPLSVSLGTSFCRASLDRTGSAADSVWTLEDGVFNCDVLPPCVPTCSGPHPELLQVWSRHCACSSEWTVHSLVMAGSLVMLLYLVVNVARKLIVRGISQIYWRLLSDGKMKILGYCDMNGRLLFSSRTGTLKVKIGQMVNTHSNPVSSETLELDNSIPSPVGPLTTANFQRSSVEENDFLNIIEEERARVASVRDQAKAVMRAYEWEGRMLILLSIFLLVGGCVLLITTPQHLQYRP